MLYQIWYKDDDLGWVLDKSSDDIAEFDMQGQEIFKAILAGKCDDSRINGFLYTIHR